jgi:outer membrane protein assembly factor BamB
MKTKWLAIGIILLFIASAVIPITLSLDDRYKNNTDFAEKYGFDRYLYPEYYDCYNVSERVHRMTVNTVEENAQFNFIESATVSNLLQPPRLLDGPMNSPWPMHGHDVRHSGRSPYITSDNSGWEKWRFTTDGWAMGSPSIDNNGIIYIGSWDLNAVYPNGTLKWKYDMGRIEHSCPAIDENGTLYIGSNSGGDYIHAINPNGTTKWKYPADSYIVASPAINEDGVIYYAGGDSSPGSGHITALYPNGTLKWRFPTNHVMYSSPAIGQDGTIYCGSHDDNVYAIYPNGTLKWKYNTGSWVHGSPTIADDGTVYIGSDTGYFYAFNPDNGSVIWSINIGSVYGSPALDKDGTIYTGVWENTFYAIYPNGTIKWSFNTGAHVWSSSPALSDDDTLFFGTCNLEWSGGVEIIALYTNGTVKWRKGLDTVFSSPAIGADGTVYIGSNSEPGDGYLNAFGHFEPNAPIAPTITGQINGKIKTIYDYTFTSSSPLGKQLYYLIDWGDDTTTDWLGPFNSGESIMMNHSWVNKGTYNIKARARDTDNLWGPWGELEITMPYSYEPQFPFIQWLLERFPNAFPILRFLLEFNH